MSTQTISATELCRGDVIVSVDGEIHDRVTEIGSEEPSSAGLTIFRIDPRRFFPLDGSREQGVSVFFWVGSESDQQILSDVRRAVVRGSGVTPERVSAYLPANYDIESSDDDSVTIVGTDNAGWTLDRYCIPRLASGCMFATEVER